MDEERGTQRQIAQRYRDRVAAVFARSPGRRLRFWITVLAVLGGAAGIYLAQKRTPQQFFNTGPLSRHHRALENDCASCHEPESLGRGAAVPERVLQVLNDRFRNGAPSFTRIDQSCQKCHTTHDFHEPNVVENRSCSACHEEHQGPGPMPTVTTLDCAACHNDGAIMQASAELGKQIPASHFRLNPKVAGAAWARPNTLKLPRPVDGYTTVFASFSEGHPPFQLHRENFREADVLRFNHQRHLEGADIPPTKLGTKLDCAYCHQPEPNGRFMKRVTFEANCQECHALQFDVKNPSFQLPHGDAQLVRTFLRTLPAQYGDFARRQGMTNETQIGQFAAVQIKQLLAQFGSAQELERAVFFTKNPYKGTESSGGAARANYAGCAYCHEVKQSGGGAFPMATVVAPLIIDRWMPHAHFSHARHEGVISCRECHVSATASQLTSDVLMPTKESCTTCHSTTAPPLKRVSAECSLCHTYHAPKVTELPTAGVAGSFKDMLLGESAAPSAGPSALDLIESP